jgi:hypothetical protein
VCRVGESGREQWRGEVISEWRAGSIEWWSSSFNGRYVGSRESTCSVVVAVGKWMCGGRNATAVSNLPKSNERYPREVSS